MGFAHALRRGARPTSLGAAACGFGARASERPTSCRSRTRRCWRSCCPRRSRSYRRTHARWSPGKPSAQHGRPANYPELGAPRNVAPAGDLALLADITLSVTVELGRTNLRVKELLDLGEGSVVELDRPAGAAVDILVNGTLVARGDVVVVDDELGVRVSEVMEPSEQRGGV